MQRNVRLGLGLAAALAFSPTLAVGDIGTDSSSMDFPPVAESQLPQEGDSTQAASLDQNSESSSVGAASSEPDRTETRWSESPFRDNN
jgi:hypothetical protein